jgi:hypothetical protein
MKAIKMMNDDTRLLSQDAWLIVQIHPKEKDELSLTSLVEFDQRRYGNTLLVFYKRAEERV